MATSTSNFFLFVNDHNSEVLSKPLEEVLSSDFIVDDNTRYRPPNESQLNLDQVQLSKYPSEPIYSPNSLLGKTEIVSIEKVDGDKKQFPVLESFTYTFNNNDYFLNSNLVQNEVFNFTTVISSESTSLRHRLGLDVDLAYPIFLRNYKRTAKNVRPYIEWEFSSELETYGTNQLYDDNNLIQTSFLNTTVNTFMVDNFISTNREIIVNKSPQDLMLHLYVGPRFSSGTTYDYKPVLEELRLSIDSTRLLTEFFPTTTDFILYEESGTQFLEWTAVNDFSASLPNDKHYILNNGQGEVIINQSETGFVGKLFCSYTSMPRVEYVPKNTLAQPAYEAKETIESRHINSPEEGSFIYSIEDTDNYADVTLVVSSEDLSYSNPYWQGIYYGDPPVLIKIQALNIKTNLPVSDLPLKIKGLFGLGKVLGSRNDEITLTTDKDGYVEFYFKPPSPSQNSVGTTSVEKALGTDNRLKIVDKNYYNFANDNNALFLYGIYKDDPLLGRIEGTNDAEEMVVWDSFSLNGRRRILYNYSTSAINPIDNSTGAYIPVLPSYIGRDSVVFSTSLPEYNATDTSNMLGGLWLVGDRFEQFDVEINPTSKNDLPSFKKRKIDKSFQVKVSFDSKDKGYVSEGGSYKAFGWKLDSTSSTSATRLGGPLFLSLNYLSGDYDILYGGGTASYPVPSLDLSFEVVGSTSSGSASYLSPSSYYRFDEGTDSLTYDIAGTGTVRTGTAYYHSWVDSTTFSLFPSNLSTSVLYFSGAASYVNFPSYGMGGTSLSFSCWVNYSALPYESFCVGFQSYNADFLFFGNFQNDLQFWSNVSGSRLVSTTAPLSTGTWLHIGASVNDSGNLALYLNGTEIATGAGSVPAYSTRAAHDFGKSFQYNGNFKGYAADFCYFEGTALTEAQFATLWNNGNGINANEAIVI